MILKNIFDIKKYFWKRKVFGKILKTLLKIWKIIYSNKNLFVLSFGETSYTKNTSTKNTLISRNIVKHTLITLSIAGEIFKRIYLIFKDYIALKKPRIFLFIYK